MEGLTATETGEVQVTGRWFGVRGRRFVRPTLVVMVGPDQAERTFLAGLEHQPWSTQDGDLWTATFPVDVGLDEVSGIALSVAPDIEISLRSAAGEPLGGRVAGADARRARATETPAGRRPSARTQDVERLRTRLAAAEQALEREHDRRSAAERALEIQRADGRRLSAELGRVRAELDLARTAARELEMTSAALDSVRRELRASERRYEQLASAPPEPRVRTAPPAQRPAAPDPAEITRLTLSDASRPRAAAAPRSERPLNPSLRQRAKWFKRLVALLVIAAVIVAVYLVLHTTIHTTIH